MTTKELVEICERTATCEDCQYTEKCNEFETEYGKSPTLCRIREMRKRYNIPDEAYSDTII